MRTITTPLLIALAAAAAVLAPPPMAAHAQSAPPPPLPLEPVAFPDFHETTLANGARVLVVPSHEVPLVTVNLVIPGGSAADPQGREGLASLTAQMLTEGTATHSHREIAEALDFLGANLGAGAGRDEISVSLSALTSALDPALEIMADVVLNPGFPADRLELLRTRTLSALRVQMGQSGALAGRAFTRAVYGDHPYGRLETPTSLQALAREDMAAFHGERFSPAAALFVVAGDVTPEDAVARLERAFRGWEGAPPAPVTYPQAVDRAAPEVILVHKPGSVQAEVRVGHLLPPGNHPAWTPLAVANQVLGGGASGRLFKVLREQKGYTYGAYSSVSRARGQGAFQASAAVRNDVLEEALTDLITQVRTLRDQPVPPDELADNQAFLVGSFPLRIETPQQVAAQVATNRLLGLPEDALETYRSRVAALDPDRVQGVFRQLVNPDRMVIVVVGDATVLLDQLRSFGPIRIETPEGEVLDAMALVARERSHTFNGAGLEPTRLTYQISFQDNPVGTTERTLSRADDGTLTFTSIARLGPQSVTQSVTVEAADLTLVGTDATIALAGQEMGGRVRRQGNRLVGSVSSPAGVTEVDMEVPEGVMVSDMLELALWVSDLEEGDVIQVPLANVQTGSVENLSIRIGARSQLTVPAGTFEVIRVDIEGSEAQTAWVRAEAPHIVVRVEPAAQPIVMELASVEAGGR
ncbi:MAG: insulinase family protein [Longimicrobiales bacterium]|nr:insulinase family protein [Longimicrobiales bacterium]